MQSLSMLVNVMQKGMLCLMTHAGCSFRVVWLEAADMRHVDSGVRSACYASLEDYDKALEAALLSLSSFGMLPLP